MNKKEQYIYFAGEALSGITSNHHYALTPEEATKLAHTLAEKMMQQMPKLIV